MCKKNCVMYFVFFTRIIHWQKFWYIFRALLCQSSFQHFCCWQLQHFYQCWSHTRTSGFPTGHGLSRTILSCTRHFSSYSSWCSYCHLWDSPGTFCGLVSISLLSAFDLGAPPFSCLHDSWQHSVSDKAWSCIAVPSSSATSIPVSKPWYCLISYQFYFWMLCGD